MTDLNLAGLLATITDPAQGGGSSASFAVRSIPGFPRHYVGRNGAGQPSLLLGSAPGPFHTPVRLALLEARFGTLHRIQPEAGDEREELLSVVSCTAPDVQAQSYFVHIAQTIVRIVGPEPTLAEIVIAFQRLIDLFRHIARPATRSLNGLFGELVLIAASRNPSATTKAWRSSDYDRFDFAAADVRLDVKVAGDRARAHYLSAEQCQPPPGTVGLLASVFVERSGGGQSLSEILQTIERSLAGEGDLILKVQESVAETLGETLPSAMDARFDSHLARSSVRFYNLATVPAIRDNVPPEVSQVHFRSDLTNCTALSLGDILMLAPSAVSLLPSDLG